MGNVNGPSQILLRWKSTSCLGERPWRWNVAPSTLTAAGNLLRNVCRKGRTFVLAWAACKPKFVLPSMSIGHVGAHRRTPVRLHVWDCGSCVLNACAPGHHRWERNCCYAAGHVLDSFLRCVSFIPSTGLKFMPPACPWSCKFIEWWLKITAHPWLQKFLLLDWWLKFGSPPMTSEVPTSGLMTEVCSPPMTSEVPTSGLMTEVCSPPMTSEVPTSGLMTEVCSPPMTSEVPTSGLMTEVCSPPMPSEVPTSGLMTEVCSPPMTSEVPTSGLMTEVCSPPMTSEVPTSGLMTEVCSPPMTSEFSMCGLMTKYYHHSSTAGILRPFQTHKKGRLFRGGSIYIYIHMYMYICICMYIYIVPDIRLEDNLEKKTRLMPRADLTLRKSPNLTLRNSSFALNHTVPCRSLTLRTSCRHSQS